MALSLRAAAALLLMCVALLCGAALGATTCLAGTIDLTFVGNEANETVFCNSTACSLQFEISFDAAAADSQAWPLSVTLQDGTTLAERWPDLDSVTLQCNSAGDIIASTRWAGDHEHLRLIWTYAGASSTLCSYSLGAVDWDTDFQSAQALWLFTANSTALADAMWSSTDAANYSLAAQTVDCPEPTGTSDTTGAPTSDTTGTATTGYVPAVLGDCRYPLQEWQTTRLNSAAWLAVADATFCTVPLRDLVLGTGDAQSLPPSFAALVAQVGAEMLNDAMYGTLIEDVNDTAVQQAHAIVSQSLNCASSHDFSGLIAQLALRNNATATCSSGDVCSAETMAQIKEAVIKAATKKEKGLLAGLIVSAVVAGVLLIVVVVLAVYIVYHLWRDRSGAASGLGGTMLGYAPVTQACSAPIQASHVLQSQTRSFSA